MDDDHNRRMLDINPEDLRPYHLDPRLVGPQLMHLQKTVEDMRDTLTAVKITVMGADGTNGIKSRVVQLEVDQEMRTVRIHERIDSLGERMSKLEIKATNNPTYGEMENAISRAIAGNAIAVEMAIERALKKHSEGNWAVWVQLIATLGTLVAVVTAIV